MNAGNVEFVDYEEDLIISALERACFDNGYRKIVEELKNPYGDGNAIDKILDILTKQPVPKELKKEFIDLWKVLKIQLK